MPVDARAKALIEERKHAYVQTFSGPLGELVLEDLARFCRAEESTFHQDARAHALLEGRREAYLRIAHHINRSLDELCAMHGAKQETS